jgi:hypothetical protein
MHRVVDTDVDARMGGERQQRRVRRVDEQVVDDDTHRNAALRRAQQCLGRQDSDVVGAPDEVLDFDAVSRVIDEPRSREQRLPALLEDQRAREAGVGADRLVDDRTRIRGRRRREQPRNRPDDRRLAAHRSAILGQVRVSSRRNTPFGGARHSSGRCVPWRNGASGRVAGAPGAGAAPCRTPREMRG